LLSNHKILPHELIGYSYCGYHIEVLVEHNDVTGIFVSQKNDEYYILKVALTREAVSLVDHEEHIIKSMTHWGVVSFISRIEINGFPALVLHRYIRGALTQYIGLLSMQEILHIFIRLCEVCMFLLENDILHRDIKPDNIVLDDTGRPVLIDFGMSCFTGTQEEYFMGTVEYAAPEVIAGQKATFDSEMYSVASVIYTLLHGSPPSKASIVHVEHGLGAQHDMKLNRMLRLEPSFKKEKKEKNTKTKISKRAKSKSSIWSYIFIALIVVLWVFFILFIRR